MKGLKHILCLLTVSALLLSCENKRADIMALTMPKMVPSQQGAGITMIYTDSANLKMVLKANKMLMFEKNVSEPFTILPKGVMVGFYNAQGKLDATLKANYGVRYSLRKRMEVKYNVELVNKNGEVLNTEHLIWDEIAKKMTSDAFVKITTADKIIMGKGIESNQDFTNYQIKEVTGTIQVKN